MRHLKTTIIGFSILMSALLSPGVMAQPQSVELTTYRGGEVEQQVPCRNPEGRPVKCPWEKPGKGTLTNNNSTDEEAKKNPCNPKDGKPVDTKACRDYIFCTPKPPTNPK